MGRLSAAPRGVPQIEVTFDIDANGILNVSARDKATGREQKITITASSGLSEEEIQRMVKEAEQHAAEDARRKSQVEAMNQADSAIFTAENLLRDHGERLPEDGKKQAREKIDAVQKAKEGGDVTQIRAATDELMRYIQTLGASLYSQPGQGEPQSGSQQEGSKGGDSGEDVVDAEFTEA
nr:MAG: hypothetical protein DIU68_13300 [Chloroflexota bacterium]